MYRILFLHNKYLTQLIVLLYYLIIFVVEQIVLWV